MLKEILSRQAMHLATATRLLVRAARTSHRQIAKSVGKTNQRTFLNSRIIVISFRQLTARRISIVLRSMIIVDAVIEVVLIVGIEPPNQTFQKSWGVSVQKGGFYCFLNRFEHRGHLHDSSGDVSDVS